MTNDQESRFDHIGLDIPHHTAVLEPFLAEHDLSCGNDTVPSHFHDVLVEAAPYDAFVSAVLRASLRRDELKAKDVNGLVAEHVDWLDKDRGLGRDRLSGGGRGGDVGRMGGSDLSECDEVRADCIVF